MPHLVQQILAGFTLWGIGSFCLLLLWADAGEEPKWWYGHAISAEIIAFIFLGAGAIAAIVWALSVLFR